jgi:hypothetical protein
MPDPIDFLVRRFVLPSGQVFDVLYLGKASIEMVKKVEQPMEEYVDEFVEALDLDLITPEAFVAYGVECQCFLEDGDDQSDYCTLCEEGCCECVIHGPDGSGKNKGT